MKKSIAKRLKRFMKKNRLMILVGYIEGESRPHLDLVRKSTDDIKPYTRIEYATL